MCSFVILLSYNIGLPNLLCTLKKSFLRSKMSSESHYSFCCVKKLETSFLRLLPGNVDCALCPVLCAKFQLSYSFCDFKNYNLKSSFLKIHGGWAAQFARYADKCVAVCCSVLQSVAVCCSVLQCVAVYCSVAQCGAVCCSVL